MSSLGPDGTFLEEREGDEAATDLSAAPLWAAFRDRYTRARERSSVAINEPEWTDERPDGCLVLACCA